MKAQTKWQTKQTDLKQTNCSYKPCEHRKQSPGKWSLLLPRVFRPYGIQAHNWYRPAASGRSSDV